MRRARIAIVHPQLRWGGSEATALWAFEAIKDCHDTSFVTCGEVDLQRLNEYYGTHFDPRETSIIRVPVPFGVGNTLRFPILQNRLIQRYCKKVAPYFDLMISAYNPCDFGVRGMQFVADVSFMGGSRAVYPQISDKWISWRQGDSLLKRAYLKLCDWVHDSDPRGWEKNVTLANSNWTAELMHRTYGTNAVTLYPPVADGFPSIPYSKREVGFVCIGRIVREKRVEIVIQVLERIRRRGHNVHLHIVGEIDDPQYKRTLQRIYLKHREWIFLEGRLFGERKRELIAKHRFGINGREIEPFGIAVAEMVKAGCIVFLPNGGGQLEIVNHPGLIYENVEDAVEKIAVVLENRKMEDSLREYIRRCAQKFSVEAFKNGVRLVVSEFLNGGAIVCRSPLRSRSQ